MRPTSRTSVRACCVCRQTASGTETDSYFTSYIVVGRQRSLGLGQSAKHWILSACESERNIAYRTICSPEIYFTSDLTKSPSQHPQACCYQNLKLSYCVWRIGLWKCVILPIRSSFVDNMVYGEGLFALNKGAHWIYLFMYFCAYIEH